MKALIIGIVLLIVFIIAPLGTIAVVVYGDAVGANKSETQIFSKYKDGKNIHGQYVGKMVDLAKVRTMMVDDQERLIKAVFGEDGRAGNQASWQWIKENNPTADLTVQKQMASIIDAMRNKFMNHQTSLIAICQPYQEKLGHPLHGFILNFLGYPDKRLAEQGNVTIAKMCEPIQSSQTKEAFETGIDDGVKF